MFGGTGWRALIAAMRLGTYLATLLLLTSSMSIAQDDRVSVLYSEAHSAETTGQYAVAIEKYQQIVRLAPDLAAAYNNLGRLYYQQGQLEEAVHALSRACELDAKLAPPRALLGFAYFQMGDYKASSRELAIASKLNPADRNVSLFLARSLLKSGELRQAEHLIESLEKESPDNPEVLYTAGQIYSDLAESVIGKIQTVDPNSYLIEVLLAKVSAAKDLWSDAAEHYKRAIDRSPKISELYYQYGHALWASKNDQGALEAFHHAISLDAYDSRATWEAGRIELTRDPADALRLVTRALQIDPNIPEALKIQGQALLTLHRPKEAIDALQKASVADPEDDSVHFHLARAYHQAGFADKAAKEDAIFQQMEDESHNAKNPN
jgi:tetratricopeptide (TPR) repeat protein